MEGEGEVVVVFPVSWLPVRVRSGVRNRKLNEKVEERRVYLLEFLRKKIKWKLTKDCECRIYYRVERLWRRYGGGRGSACMSRKNEMAVAVMDIRLLI